MDESVKAAILASLTASLVDHNRQTGYAEDPESVFTDEGDMIAGVRDYIENTATDSLDKRAVAEVAYAWLAGAEHESANTTATRAAFGAIRRAGLSL